MTDYDQERIDAITGRVEGATPDDLGFFDGMAQVAMLNNARADLRYLLDLVASQQAALDALAAELAHVQEQRERWRLSPITIDNILYARDGGGSGAEAGGGRVVHGNFDPNSPYVSFYGRGTARRREPDALDELLRQADDAMLAMLAVSELALVRRIVRDALEPEPTGYERYRQTLKEWGNL